MKRGAEEGDVKTWAMGEARAVKGEIISAIGISSMGSPGSTSEVVRTPREDEQELVAGNV